MGQKPAATLPADPDVMNYSYALVGGQVYYRENSVMVRPELTASAEGRVRGMIALRDCVHGLIAFQMDEHSTDAAIQAKQQDWARLYDAFSARYGLINDRANRQAFDKDSAYYLLCSLEILDDDGNLKRKADMFTKRTIQVHRAVTHVDTAAEALAVSIGERARVDLEFIGVAHGRQRAHPPNRERPIRRHLQKSGNRPPLTLTNRANTGTRAGRRRTSNLSGNVRRKLRAAQVIAEQDPFFAKNVEALQAAQPRDLDASENRGAPGRYLD